MTLDRPASAPPDSFWQETAPEEQMPDSRTLADFPTAFPLRQTPLPETPPIQIQKRSGRVRVVPLLVSASLICFLVATGLLTFLLLNNSQAHQSGPQLTALPGELRVGDVLQLAGSGFEAHHVVALSHDGQAAILDAQGQRILPTTNAQGAFQIRVPIGSAWSIGVHSLQAREGNFQASTSLTIEAALAGPASLQLAISHIDLGAGNPGAVTHKNMTLSNAGGGQVSWTAKSSVAWLSLSPASGTFAGDAVIVLTVNRANLAPQAYLGQVIFTQSQGPAQTLYVSMTVNTTPANLVLSTASLAFAGTPAQSPAGQTMVIQNSGGQPLNWTAAYTTSNGLNWLSMTPASGMLGPNTSAILTVNVNTIKMALGSYQGTLSFSYAGGQAQQVAIALTVSPPPQPGLRIAPTSLSFTANQGINPAPRSFTISNPGNAPLNWAIHADAQGQAYLAITPVSGSVPPGQSAKVSIAPILGSASGTISSTLTIQDSDPGSTVASQQVKVSITITDQPVITMGTGNIVFNHDSTDTDDTDLLIFYNTGNLPLHWALSASAQVPWLSFDLTSGTLVPGDSAYIKVHCVSSSMKPGTYTVTLTLKDTDSGTVVAPQTVTVTLVVT
jgi:BACON domain-containing protein